MIISLLKLIFASAVLQILEWLWMQTFLRDPMAGQKFGICKGRAGCCEGLYLAVRNLIHVVMEYAGNSCKDYDRNWYKDYYAALLLRNVDICGSTI